MRRWLHFDGDKSWSTRYFVTLHKHALCSKTDMHAAMQSTITYGGICINDAAASHFLYTHLCAIETTASHSFLPLRYMRGNVSRFL